ncbi:MAG: transposase family protein [Desulfovibrio sp.]|nr:transposase family protein [Desulfovibrio sp.]
MSRTKTIFRKAPDPRVERTKVHRFEIIMFISLCTCLSGGEGFYEMATYTQTKANWLRRNIGMKSVCPALSR